MRATEVLPEGYKEIYSVDLQKDKKAKVGINLFAVLLGVLLAVPVHFLIPISTLFDMEAGLGLYALRFGVLILLSVLYVILHEAVHGAAMKLCGTKRVKYGFTGLYAFAGSDDYYGKGAYIFIALSPVVLWGALLAVACLLVPTAWFWVVYIIQITNLSGAAGDFFVTAKFARMPKDILVRDVGVGMTVYSQSRAE
jgi:hypothetical protein